jgi:hypothetical protein
MSKTERPAPPVAVDPELRQRRTVTGFLDDLRARILRKRAEMSGCDSDRTRILAELTTMETLLESWDSNGDAQ